MIVAYPSGLTPVENYVFFFENGINSNMTVSESVCCCRKLRDYSRSYAEVETESSLCY